MRLLEGLALLELDRVEESAWAFNEAIRAAETLLALADRNVAALQARVLALTGLAAVVGDLALAAKAGEALGVANGLAGPAGVAADTRRTLDQIAHHNQSGILAKVRKGSVIRRRAEIGLCLRFRFMHAPPVQTRLVPARRARQRAHAYGSRSVRLAVPSGYVTSRPYPATPGQAAPLTT